LAYQVNSTIDKLPRSIASVADSLHEQTGWCVTIMLGGPLPRDEGHITTLVYVQIFFALSTTEKVFYSYHAGQTKDGKDFETFLGKAEFEDRISHQYDDFLHKVFSRCRTDDMKSN